MTTHNTMYCRFKKDSAEKERDISNYTAETEQNKESSNYSSPFLMTLERLKQC